MYDHNSARRVQFIKHAQQCGFTLAEIPIAAAGLINPVLAMTVSVTAIFFNSLWGTPPLVFDAIRSVGQPIVRPDAGRPRRK